MNILKTEKKTNNKIYNISGISRSGNHAIIFWIINNLIDEDLYSPYPYLYATRSNKLCYLNNLSRKPFYLDDTYLFSKYDIIIKSYEDDYFNENTNIIILRDFINMLSSRYKKYYPMLGFDSSYINYIHKLISVWKQHVSSYKRLIIYNRWVESKDYRDEISEKVVGIKNIRDNIYCKTNIGEGSSFTDDNYLKRYNQINFPKFITDQILMDKQLIATNRKMFGIDIEQILQCK